MMDDQEEYIVVFQYTADAGAYAENRFWTSYQSHTQFEGDVTDGWLNAAKLQVVAKGVTENEAIRLCGQVPLYAQLTAVAFEYGSDPECCDLMMRLTAVGHYTRKKTDKV